MDTAKLQDFLTVLLNREPGDNTYSRGRRSAFMFVMDIISDEEYQPFYTVDVPHRIVNLRESGRHGVLVDVAGEEYPHWMVRPL